MPLFSESMLRSEGSCNPHTLEVMGTLGRDSRVFYQNAASRAIKVHALGAPLIHVTDFFNAEEIRDEIFAGRSVRYIEQEVRVARRILWVNRLYEPLFDDDGVVVGMISRGTSALKTGVEMLALRRLNRLIEMERRARRISSARRPFSA